MADSNGEANEGFFVAMPRHMFKTSAWPAYWGFAPQNDKCGLPQFYFLVFVRRRWERSFSFSSQEYDMISVFWRLMGRVTDQGSV